MGQYMIKDTRQDRWLHNAVVVSVIVSLLVAVAWFSETSPILAYFGVAPDRLLWSLSAAIAVSSFPTVFMLSLMTIGVIVTVLESLFRFLKRVIPSIARR